MDKYEMKARQIVDKLTPKGGCARPWVNEMVAAALREPKEAVEEALECIRGLPCHSGECAIILGKEVLRLRKIAGELVRSADAVIDEQIAEGNLHKDHALDCWCPRSKLRSVLARPEVREVGDQK